MAMQGCVLSAENGAAFALWRVLQNAARGWRSVVRRVLSGSARAALREAPKLENDRGAETPVTLGIHIRREA